MQFIKHENTATFENSPGCTATEYDFKNENDLNIAGITLDGRYPDNGYALNTVSKELMYVTHGHGTLFTSDKNVTLNQGDAVLIQPHERYYLEGTLELVISSSPAWRPEQHQNISNELDNN